MDDYVGATESKSGADGLPEHWDELDNEADILEAKQAPPVESWDERVAWGLVDEDGEEVLVDPDAALSDDEEAFLWRGGAADIAEEAKAAGEEGKAPGEEGKAPGEEGKAPGGKKGLRIVMPRKPCYMSKLSDDLCFVLLRFLDADALGVLACCSKWLNRNATNEALFQWHCESTYPMQCDKGQLRVDRWGGWRAMFTRRPRLRVNGFYFQRVAYIKKPEKNMWYTGEEGTVLECTYYRYLRFFNNGRALYGISLDPPKVAARSYGHVDAAPKDVHAGAFTVLPGRVIRVEVLAPNGRVELELQLTDGERGKFARLILTSHRQFPRQATEPRDIPLLAQCFKFRRLPIRKRRRKYDS